MSQINNMENMSILIVEDDKDLQKQLYEYLEMFFDKIYMAENGKEGYESYLKYSPDLIITDINMPNENGIEFIKKIRNNGDDRTYIIILSAYTNTDYFLEVIKLNLTNYLVKPFKSDELKETIVDVKNKIKHQSLVYLKDNFKWDKERHILFDNKDVVNLTSYETQFIKRLFEYKNKCVSYVDIHYHLYVNEDFSQDAITSLVKRIRKKVPQGLIKSCYKEGYKLEI